MTNKKIRNSLKCCIGCYDIIVYKGSHGLTVESDTNQRIVQRLARPWWSGEFHKLTSLDRYQKSLIHGSINWIGILIGKNAGNAAKA